MAIASPPNATVQFAYEPPRRKWTVAEFERFIDLCVFGPEEKLELVEGEIVQKMTQNAPHVTAILKVNAALVRAFAADHHVRQQAPLNFGAESGNRPEPDVAVIYGTIDEFAAQLPRTAALVVEVSDSTLRFDRQTKSRMYAGAGIQEYWIVNIVDRQLEVFRQPVAPFGEPSGHTYLEVVLYTEEQMVSALSAPDIAIRVADLLP